MNKIKILSQTILYPFIILVIIMLISNSSNLSENNKNITRQAAYSIIKKTIMQCYASEGSYPNDLKYLEDHYGLILDKKNFIYEYNIFSSNIMPEIIIHDNLMKDKNDEQ